ncbi:MAG: DUF4411 family protein [Burkholderiales bacterium]|nr:DUF4411 family protein [Burkholderiales bacterium]
MQHYCADTSALIAAWVERYPPEHFPGLWDRFADLIQAGRIFAPDEVRAELKKRSTEVADWLDQFDSFFRSPDEGLLLRVADILAKFPKLVMAHKSSFAADPFVIALAGIEGAFVLTEEGVGSAGKPSIPYVCRAHGITSVNLIEVIRAEKWKLSS